MVEESAEDLVREVLDLSSVKKKTWERLLVASAGEAGGESKCGILNSSLESLES